MMPSANICAPEKIAMIEARNGKPGTLAAADEIAAEHAHQHAEAEEREAESDHARELQRQRAEAVIMFIACVNSLRIV